MITQRFKLTDIQRSLVGENTFAAATLTPLPAEGQTPMAPGAVTYPNSVRHSGLAGADVAGWEPGDIVVVTLGKETV